MRRIAFVFPGQGAQYTGMGKDFYENIPESREAFDLASKAAGLDIPALCFEKNERLDITEYTQAAMLACEAAILAAVWKEGIISEVNAGLSLGEYGALLASRAMTMQDAFYVVRKRGIFMQEAVPTGGAMAAVLGMESEKAAAICSEVGELTRKIVSVANYNCPGQVVITGETKAVEKAAECLKKEGAKRVLLLNVSGPFHSEMLKGAGEKLYKVLKQVEIQKPQTPYVANVTAEYVTEEKQIPDLLKRQLFSPVYWQQSVEAMRRAGINTFIEIGPGHTLTGFLKKIDRSAVGLHIENLEELEKAIFILQKEADKEC